MPIGNWNLEWLNHNSQRKYPLADDATATDTSGAFVLPDDFLVELDLPVHAGMDVDPGRFFVLNVGAYATGYSIIVGYQPAANGVPVPVASALIPRQTHTPYATYALGGVEPFDDTLGKVVIGRLDNIDNQPPGFWTLTLTSARLDTDAVRPIIRGVAALVCVNGDQKSERLVGDIELVAGSNLQLIPILLAGQDPIIRINAIQGEGTVEQCVCAGTTAPTDPIRRISGIAPTPTGDFAIVGSDCLQVQPITNGLKIVDTCAQPCCGPTELERITTDLERLGAQAAAVQDFVRRLQTAVDTMDLIVLGAKLGDRGCVQ